VNEQATRQDGSISSKYLKQRLTEKANRFMREQPRSNIFQVNDVEIQENDVTCPIFCTTINTAAGRRQVNLKDETSSA